MITIDINSAPFEAAFSELDRLLGDLTKVMNEIGEQLAVSTQDRLKAGKSPSGAAFAPRSPATIKNYERRKLSFDLPLYRSGNLYNQIHSESGADFAEVRSSSEQAAMMHFGGTKAAFPHLWGDIPARPFLGVSEEDRIAILETLAEHIMLAASP